MKPPFLLLVLLLSAPACAQADPEGERLYGRPPEAPAARPATVEPNIDTGRWSMQHTELGRGRHRLHLELDRLHIGGDGEVRALVMRWAEEVVRSRGLAGFHILRLEEGVLAGWLVGQRYADAEVQFVESATFGTF